MRDCTTFERLTTCRYGGHDVRTKYDVGSFVSRTKNANPARGQSIASRDVPRCRIKLPDSIVLISILPGRVPSDELLLHLH